MSDDTSLWLELTPSCNLSCAFCYNPWRSGGKTSYPPSASYDALRDGVGRLLGQVSFRYVALSGGEPLLYPRLVDLTRWLSNSGQRTILTTNGRLLTAQRLTALRGAGLDGVQVSLLGSRAQTHDALAGRASWMQALAALARARAESLSTSATFIATLSNIEELNGVVELVARLGVEHLVVNELQPVGSAAEQLPQLDVSPAAFQRAIASAEGVATRVGVRLHPIHARSGTSTQGAVSGWRRWSVSPDGKLKLCNHSTRTLGSLTTLDDESLTTLAHCLRDGDYASVEHAINNCLCFERALQESLG